MCSKQCMGITKKGARCLIKVHQGEFCHHHVPNRCPGKTRLEPGPISGRHDDKYPSKSSQKSSKSLPSTPQKASLPTPGSTKNYTTASSSQVKSHSCYSFLNFGSRSPSPIKYNNLDKPSGQTPSSSPKRRPIDYSAIASSPRCRNSPKVESAIQPGYIYVYTLASFLSKHSEGGWIQTRNLSKDKKYQDKWLDVDMRRSQKMLVKVGMTTKTPAIRISQWEAKCNHKLQCLYPGSHPNLGKSSLSKMFGSLSLGDKAEGDKFSMYVEHHQGFFVPRNILHCEQQIHSILKQRFGRGEIHCKGCHQSSQEEVPKRSILDVFRSKDDFPSKADYNIHNEWFPVPRKSLNDVFSIINNECKKYTP